MPGPAGAGGVRGNTRRAGGDGTGKGAVDYDAIYGAARESNARLRYWIYSVYSLHGLPAPQLYRSPYTPATHGYAARPLRLLLLTRCLVLELWSFQAIHGHYTRIKGGLAVKKKGGLDMIIKGHKVHGRLKALRDGIAHSGITLGEFASQVNMLGLDALVHYARAALMFEDAAYDSIPHRDRGREAGASPHMLAFRLPRRADRASFDDRHSGARLSLDEECHRRDLVIMWETNHSLRMLYRGLYVAASSVEGDPTYGRHMINDHLHNVKYMILDIHCFTEKFRKLGLDRLVKTGFYSRAELYEGLRHDYSAHTKIGRVRGIHDMLESHPRLLDNLLLDAVEIDVLSSRLLGHLEAIPRSEILPMNDEQAKRVDQGMWETQVKSHGFYGFEHVEHYGGLTGDEARERARRDLGTR